MKQQNQQRIQHCSHCHVHSTYTYSVTNDHKDLLLSMQFVGDSPDKSNQLCLCKYNKECRVESVIYSAIWFRSNLFYSAFFGRISVNFYGIPVPDIPWVVAAFNQEKALVGAFPMIVKTDGLFATLDNTSTGGGV